MRVAVLAPNKPFWGARIVQIPFLQALRETFPKAEVHVHSPVEAAAELVRWRLVDSHRAYARGRWAGLLAELRHHRPDRVYNLRRKSAGCALATGAQRGVRIGYDEGLFARFLDERIPYDSRIYLATRYVALMHPDVLDGHDARTVPLFRAWLETRVGGGCAEKRVVLFPGAGNPQKKWPLERFLELAEPLREATGCEVTAVLGPQEREEHWRLVGDPRVEVLDTPTVNELLRLVDCSALVVSNDNGPSHFAQLSGRRFLGLYRAGWSTVEDWFLDKENSDLIVTDPGETMEAIPLERVLAAARRLLRKPEMVQELVPFSREEAARARAR